MNNCKWFHYIFELNEVLLLIEKAIAGQSRLLLTAINMNILYRINRSKSFKKQFFQFDKISFDGYYAIVWAKVVGRKRRIDQISADTLMKSVFEQAGNKKWSFAVVGGTPITEQQFSKNVRQAYPKVEIVCHHHGYYKKDEEAGVIDLVNKHTPDILLVGLGVPKEHQWCLKHRSQLNAKVIITCGGYIEQTATHGIDYYPGTWPYKFHLNWVYRIYKEPSRLWKRYLTQGLWFLFWLPGQFIQARILKKNMPL